MAQAPATGLGSARVFEPDDQSQQPKTRKGQLPSTTPGGKPHQATDLSGQTGSQRVLQQNPPAPLTEQKGCDCPKGAQMVAIAVAILGILVGTVGLLVYLGQMQIGLTNVGMMTSEIALYTMLGGYGATFIALALLSVACCLGGPKGAGDGSIDLTPKPIKIENDPDAQSSDSN